MANWMHKEQIKLEYLKHRDKVIRYQNIWKFTVRSFTASKIGVTVVSTAHRKVN